jgi:CubicO group peptidase (beta-lactamase class C family)
MMKSQILSKYLMILIISGSFVACKQKTTDQSIVRSGKYKKSLKEAYQKLGLFYTANYIPGLTVAVSIDNHLVWADGFGYSNYELKVKASPSHSYYGGQTQ